MKNLKTFENFFKDLIFGREDDDLAIGILDSLETSLQSGDGRVRDIFKHADYKRSVKLQGESSSKVYTINIQKLSGGKDYVLVIDGKHYNAVQSKCKRIWDLLDREYNTKFYDRDNIKKDFPKKLK